MSALKQYYECTKTVCTAPHILAIYQFSSGKGLSSGKGKVVIGPDHGPLACVDVEQGTARAWLA